VLFGWFVRGLGLWLVLYIPLVLVAMATFSLGTQIATGPLVYRMVGAISSQIGECRGWTGIEAELAPISVSMQAFMDDVNGTENPDSRDARRWAT
jgi:hypothetical protein